MPSRTKRPRVICHMAASTDGRIVVDGWPDAVATAVRREYEFDLEGGAAAPRRLVLEAVERRTSDIVRLHYRVEGSTGSGV